MFKTCVYISAVLCHISISYTTALRCIWILESQDQGRVAPKGELLQNPYTLKRCGISDIYAIPVFIRRQASFPKGGPVLRLFLALRASIFAAFMQVWDSA